MMGGFGGGCAMKGGFGGGSGMKGGFGKKGGASAKATANGKGEVGEIRYDNPFHAQMAIGMLNNSAFNGGTISVDWDANSKDGTKLIVRGIPPGSEWQELKDHFGQMGTVAFADVKGAGNRKGKGSAAKGNGKGEIRYDNPMHAQLAVAMLNKTVFNGSMITVNWDKGSQDGSKLWIGGVPPGSAWQELKDHFAQVGQVAFANC